MGASELGAAWWQQRLDKNKQPVLTKDNKPIWNLSVKLELPFLGEVNLTLVPNEDEKKSDKAPAFKVLWWPPRKDTRGQGGSAPESGPPDGTRGEGAFDNGDGSY